LADGSLRSTSLGGHPPFSDIRHKSSFWDGSFCGARLCSFLPPSSSTLPIRLAPRPDNFRIRNRFSFPLPLSYFSPPPSFYSPGPLRLHGLPVPKLSAPLGKGCLLERRGGGGVAGGPVLSPSVLFFLLCFPNHLPGCHSTAEHPKLILVSCGNVQRNAEIPIQYLDFSLIARLPAFFHF